MGFMYALCMETSNLHGLILSSWYETTPEKNVDGKEGRVKAGAECYFFGHTEGEVVRLTFCPNTLYPIFPAIGAVHQVHYPDIDLLCDECWGRTREQIRLPIHEGAMLKIIRQGSRYHYTLQDSKSDQGISVGTLSMPVEFCLYRDGELKDHTPTGVVI